MLKINAIYLQNNFNFFGHTFNQYNFDETNNNLILTDEDDITNLYVTFHPYSINSVENTLDDESLNLIFDEFVMKISNEVGIKIFESIVPNTPLLKNHILIENFKIIIESNQLNQEQDIFASLSTRVNSRNFNNQRNSNINKISCQTPAKKVYLQEGDSELTLFNKAMLTSGLLFCDEVIEGNSKLGSCGSLEPSESFVYYANEIMKYSLCSGNNNFNLGYNLYRCEYDEDYYTSLWQPIYESCHGLYEEPANYCFNLCTDEYSFCQEDQTCSCPTETEVILGTFGYVCQDINECTFPDNLCENLTPMTGQPFIMGVCENFKGGYGCSCPVGFQYDPTTNSCLDINECQLMGANQRTGRISSRLRSTGETDCDTMCTNTIGSFICDCDPGNEFTWDYNFQKERCAGTWQEWSDFTSCSNDENPPSCLTGTKVRTRICNQVDLDCLSLNYCDKYDSNTATCYNYERCEGLAYCPEKSKNDVIVRKTKVTFELGNVSRVEDIDQEAFKLAILEKLGGEEGKLRVEGLRFS